MKKFLCLILAGILSLSACGNQNENGTTTQTTTEIITDTTNELTETTHLSDTTEATEAPNPEGMSSGIKENKKSIYGKKTGTKDTYTGLEPLPETTIPVVDKDNLHKLQYIKENVIYNETLIKNPRK